MIQNDALCEACCRQHGRIFETCNSGCHIRDLFEAITKERDAAVADLTNQSACWTCKKNADCHSHPVEEPSIRCGLYEWRSLSLAEITNDKEEKHE